jgi:hypothetical protein
MDLNERAIATQKTLAKYRNVSFNWKGATCIHLFRYHIRNMGYKPVPIPRFQSPVGAKRALASLGANGLIELLDTMLMRITPAQMVVGDVAVLPSSDVFDALVICAGNKFLGWHEAGGEGLQQIEGVMGAVKVAYRV